MACVQKVINDQEEKQLLFFVISGQEEKQILLFGSFQEYNFFKTIINEMLWIRDERTEEIQTT